MLNYRLKYKASEVAKFLNVEKRKVNAWAHHFSEYLNPAANPEKGIEREFTVDDVCTLGYISMYWEEDPDFENIRYGLNSNDQFEYPFKELATQITPIFREFSEELLGGKAWMIGGGMGNYFDLLTLADSYKLAGDTLIDLGIRDEQNKEMIYPAIYNYRHATELYLKALIPNHKKTHNLKEIFEGLRGLLSDEFNVTPPKWFENIIVAFDDFDPNGTTFRYGIQINQDEIFVDLIHIKKLMNWFSESIHRIKKRFGEVRIKEK